jgi:glycosyltransferase involved in cell wall biosynthesis
LLSYKKKYPEWKLKIVGEGDFKIELQAIIRRLKIKNVKLVGRVPDVLKEMSQADVCVFPTLWELEGFGLVAIEAMAMGTPVVAFDRAPVNEIITHQKNGLLAKNKNVSDLASQIEKVMTQPQLIKKLSKQAQQDFAKKYQISAISDLYLAVITDAD